MKSAPGAFLSRKDIFQLIASDLEEVEHRLKENASSSLGLVNEINSYLHDGGGKRLRPALLLLSSKMCDGDSDAAVSLSVVAELIHVATLVHDDVIDNAAVRRGQPSVNARWGNQVTVLMGDWLYMTSFQLALKQRRFRVLEVLTDATRKMVEGEIMQLEQTGRIDLSIQEHLEVCLRKTATLFSACAQLGGVLGDVDESREKRLAEYGRSLGMAFQLTDDLLDFTASQTVLGKPVLKDLEEGKITLPIIHLMEHGDRSARDFVEAVLVRQDFSPENKRRIIRMVDASGGLDDLRTRAETYAADARNCLLGFPDSIYREALSRIPDFVIQRRN